MKTITALLVHDDVGTLGPLRSTLEAHSIRLVTARNCKEAGEWLSGSNPPNLVFTAAHLPDGTWADVIDSGFKASEPVSVVVVSPEADVELYLDVMERGGFDFITQSFTGSELSHVIGCAAESVLKQRSARVP